MPFQSCKKCGADLTTLIKVKEYCVGCTPENLESQTTDTQQPQERHCSHEFVYREYIGQTPGRCASCGAIVL